MRQWGHYLDPAEADAVRAELAGAIAAGEVYLAVQDGQVAGTISLQRAPSDWDRQIWGEAAAGQEAVYVHRLAIDRKFAGQGVGDRMLDWAEQGGRAEDRRFLRLDCVAANERLNAYYARRYQYAGQAANIGMTFSRYEAVLSRR